tara:strand:- start:640 stop:1329 length:690 start_codon:yes stop_codon:yes gene_type:complete
MAKFKSVKGARHGFQFAQSRIIHWFFTHKFWGKTKLDHYLTGENHTYKKIVERVGSEAAANWMSICAHNMIIFNHFTSELIEPRCIDVIDGQNVYWVMQEGIPYQDDTVIKNFAPVRLVKFRKLQRLWDSKNAGREIPLFATISTFDSTSDDENEEQAFHDNLRYYAIYRVPLKNGQLDRNLEEHDVEEYAVVVSVVNVPDSIHDDVIHLSEMSGTHFRAPNLDLIRKK